MALVKCKECGHEVSKKAKSCPACGAPTPKRTSLLTWIIAGFFALVIIRAIFSSSTAPPSEQSDAVAPVTKTPEVSNAECKKSLQCWGERHSISATVRCQRYIEKLAKYSHKWTDGFLEPKFSHFRWKNRATGVVTFIGDKIQFQNGFGAWQNSIYECDFNPSTEQVLDVRASPGQL